MNWITFEFNGNRYSAKFGPSGVCREIARLIEVSPKRWDREPYVRRVNVRKGTGYFSNLEDAAELEWDRRENEIARMKAEAKLEEMKAERAEERKADALILAEAIGAVVDGYFDDCNKTSVLGGDEGMNRKAVRKMIIAYERFAKGAVKKVS